MLVRSHLLHSTDGNRCRRPSIPSNTSRCWRRSTARLALECGYTAARSGGCLFNVDVWLKKAIEEDLIPGPAARRERSRDLFGAAG